VLQTRIRIRERQINADPIGPGLFPKYEKQKFCPPVLPLPPARALFYNIVELVRELWMMFEHVQLEIVERGDVSLDVNNTWHAGQALVVQASIPLPYEQGFGSALI
jgi:hypothetical protein